MKLAASRAAFLAGFLLGILFNTKGGGVMFLQIIG
jgi:hypothetical protein